MSKKRTYRIDTGDSNKGPCGFVAYVDATSKTAALERLKELIDRDGYCVEDDTDFRVLVYLNPAKVKISEVERADT